MTIKDHLEKGDEIIINKSYKGHYDAILYTMEDGFKSTFWDDPIFEEVEYKQLTRAKGKTWKKALKKLTKKLQ